MQLSYHILKRSPSSIFRKIFFHNIKTTFCLLPTQYIAFYKIFQFVKKTLTKLYTQHLKPTSRCAVNPFIQMSSEIVFGTPWHRSPCNVKVNSSAFSLPELSYRLIDGCFVLLTPSRFGCCKQYIPNKIRTWSPHLDTEVHVNTLTHLK